MVLRWGRLLFSSSQRLLLYCSRKRLVFGFRLFDCFLYNSQYSGQSDLSWVHVCVCFLLTTERIDGGFPKYTHYKTFLNGEEIELKERGGSKQSECSKIIAANGLQSPPSPLEAKQQ